MKVLDAKHKSSYTEGMNKLPLNKRVQILQMLVEGSSMRSISRVVGVSINTVSKLLVEAGEACYTNPDNENQYVVAMKAAEQTCEIWISTYHRLASRQARSILKNGRILKCHD